MTDIYIYYQLTSLVDKSIICQDTGEKYFLLHYLEDALIRFLSLPLGFLLVGLSS